MKNIGLIIAIVGLVGVVYFGIDLIINDTDVNVLGMEISVKEKDYTPVIISVAILIIGAFLMKSKK